MPLLSPVLKSPVSTVLSGVFGIGGEVPLLRYRTFNGTNQYFSIPDHTDLRFGLDEYFALAGWIRRADLTTICGIVSKGNPFASGGEYGLWSWDGHGNINISVRLADDSNSTGPNLAGLSSGVWQFIVVQYEYLLDRMASKVGTKGNMPAIWSQGGPGDGGTFSGTNPFHIGESSGTFCKGDMALWGVYRDTLTDAEVDWLAAEYRPYSSLGQVGTDGEDLVSKLAAYWPLDEGNTGGCVDAHAGHDGSAVNAPGFGSEAA